jgi:hypothetical protein
MNKNSLSSNKLIKTKIKKIAQTTFGVEEIAAPAKKIW